MEIATADCEDDGINPNFMSSNWAANRFELIELKTKFAKCSFKCFGHNKTGKNQFSDGIRNESETRSFEYYVQMNLWFYKNTGWIWTTMGLRSVFDVFEYDKNTMDDGQWTTTKLCMIFHLVFFGS